MRFRLPGIDVFSLILGLLLASLGWWLGIVLRPLFQKTRAEIQNNRNKVKEKTHSPSSVEERYRQNILRHAQGLHLSSPLFSLDEIAIQPTLMAPPPRITPGEVFLGEDIATLSIPYLPAWPELAAIFQAPTLTLAQALSGNSDIILTGQAGIGKTFTLAHLASQLARREPMPDLLQDCVPILIHAADLDLPVRREEPLKAITNYINEISSFLDSARIPDFLDRIFSEGRAVLMLDGVDELSPGMLTDVVDFIKSIKKSYPGTHIVTTSSGENMGGLVTLNFIPIAVRAWNSSQRRNFLEKWGDLWTNYVAVEAWAQSREHLDPLLLNDWIQVESEYLTPLELTLKTWGAYAGDFQGPRPLNVVEAHVRRIKPDDVPMEALETLSLQACLNSKLFFTQQDTREWIRSFELPEASIQQAAEGTSNTAKNEKIQTPRGLISKLIDGNILVQHRNNQLRFLHPVIPGFLAAKVLGSKQVDTLENQPAWVGKSLVTFYQTAMGHLPSPVDLSLTTQDRPLARNLLTAARWLRDVGKPAPWREQVIIQLVELLRQSGQPLGLRGQALVALLLSRDPSIMILFRKLLEGNDFDMLQLAALGSGALQDGKAVEPLISLLDMPSPSVRRAACLALVNIGNTSAMDAVAAALLHGDEILRRAAAEALANHPHEGHAMLKEGAAMQDDLMVRRASVFGLGRIMEPWAFETVRQMETDDNQWAVRNAATEVMEGRRHPNPHIPQRLPPPTESAWIINFASKQGVGVSPDKPPVDLLLLALKSGTEEERLASLAYLRMMPVEGVFGALYQAMYGSEPTLREAVFQTLSEMAARGVPVPDPVQFGVGY